jgi:ribosomal-protein-alanine N-acetyltransferase
VYRIDPMTLEDVPEVGRVERLCFSNPWPASAYRRELQLPEQNYYLVLREDAIAGTHPIVTVNPPDAQAATPRGIGTVSLRAIPRRTLLPLGLGRRTDLSGDRQLPPIIGFAGMWVLFDEAHITTIGVEPVSRGRGLGELLLATMFDEALRRHADWLTLEVRVSNDSAQSLYRKYGLSPQGTRRRYYSDNNEDALIMWSRSLKDDQYRRELASLRQRLYDRLGHDVATMNYQLAAGD